MMELRGKCSFNLGLDCGMNKCFLIMLPMLSKVGLNVITNGRIYFISKCPAMVEALENSSKTDLDE